jgi:hypothetical protein
MWPRNKAVADGTVSYYIDHFVTTRVAKYSYGTRSSLPYDPSDPEHLSRPHAIYTDLTGHQKIRGSFDVILPKVEAVTLTRTGFDAKSCLEYQSLRNRRISTVLLYDKPEPVRFEHNQPSYYVLQRVARRSEVA